MTLKTAAPFRRDVLLLPLLVAACSSEAPPRSFAPLRYDYLTPLTLNVGTIQIDDHWQPISRADLSVFSPARPRDALVEMAEDRLKIGGSAGRAVFTIDDASLNQNGDTIFGSLAVHLDIYGSGPDRIGYAEARVARSRAGLGSRSGLPGILYDITRQMMDAMNIEFEYRVKQSLAKFLLSASESSPVATPVEQQPLPPP